MTKQTATLVTGGSNGIGEAIVNARLQLGDTVLNLDRTPPKNSSNAQFINVDLAANDALHQTLDDVVSRYDVTRVVNCAGVALLSLIDDFNEDECALALDAMSPPSPAEHRGGRERRGFLARLPARLLGPGVAGTVGRIGFRGLAARLRKRAGSQSYAGHNTGLKNGMYGQLVRVFFGKCFNRWRSRRSKWLFSGSFANSPDSENPLEVGHFSSNQIENPRSSLGGQGVERYFYLQLQHIIYFGLKNRNAPSVTRRGGTWLGYSS